MIRQISLLLITSLFAGSLYALPEIETWQTSKGVKVYYANAPELPIIDLALTFDAGSARDGDIPGLSTMMHGLIDKGTGKLNADEVASKFEDVGAQFSVSTDLDRSSVTLRSLSKADLFDYALDMYIRVITKPSFPKRDYEREKKRLLISLQNSEQRPGDIVGKTFYQMLYQDHPYAQPGMGTKQSVENISLKSIKQFHKSHITANNAVLAIVGDVTLKQAQEIAENISKALAKGKALVELAEVQPSSLAKKKVDFPSQQAHVRMGQIGIQRGHPDYYSLYVGNHVLGGGGFTSRLMKEVRSNRGLSYSVYSYFLPYAQQGPFMLGLQTRVDQAAEAIEVSEQVLQDFFDNGPTEQELSLSKQNIINGFPLRVDSNKDLLGYLSIIGYYDLPINYLNEFTQNIEQVTLEDIKTAFQKHMSLDSFITVVVGGEQAANEDA